MSVKIAELLKTTYKIIEIKCKQPEKSQQQHSRHRFVPPPLNSWTKVELPVNADEKEVDDWRDIGIFVTRYKSKRSGKFWEMQVDLIFGTFFTRDNLIFFSKHTKNG